MVYNGLAYADLLSIAGELYLETKERTALVQNLQMYLNLTYQMIADIFFQSSTYFCSIDT
jgi:hypothetical protein